MGRRARFRSVCLNRRAGSIPVSGTAMYYTYVLRSIDGKHRYVGHCKNLKSRLNQHNSRNVKATKASRPWKIIHSEKFKIREEAITRERYLKSGVGREWMDGMNL